VSIGSGGIVSIPLPHGGTAGQVLAKVDADDYDVVWVDPAGPGGGGGVALSAGANSVSNGTVVFSNSNGVSFGLNGSTITASVAGAGAPGSISAGTTSVGLGQVVFSNSNNVSFGLNGSTLTGSASFNQSVQTQGSVQVQGSTGAISFGNANGVTFGFNASTITASHNGLTSQSNQAFSANGGSSAFQTINFRDANGVTWSNSGGSVQLSYSVPTVPPETPFGVSAGTQSVSTGTVVFANSNGVSFGLSGSSQITASHNGLTTARASNDGVGLNTAQTNVTWTVNSAGISLNAGGYAGTGTSATNASITLNSNGLAISVAAPGGGGNFSAGVSNLGNTGGDTGVSGTRLVFVGSQNITLNQATDANGATISISGGAGAAGNTGFISAGGATASLGTVIFSNSNGVSFGVNGQTVTASHNGLTQQSTQPVAVSGQNGSYAFSTLSLSNANGISFGTSAGSAITASHNGLTSQSNQNVTAANGGFAFQTLSFSNVNGVSFGTSAGSAITASVAAQSVQTQNMVSVQGSTGAISFGNANGVTFGFNASTITASHNGLTSQSNQAFSAGAASSTFQTLSFQDSNGVSFSNNAGAIRVTHGLAGTTTAITGNALITLNSGGLNFNGSGLAGIGTTFNGTNVSGSMTLNTAGLRLDLSAGAGGGGGTLSVYAQSNTTQSSSGTIPASSLQFQGAGIASVGVSNGSVVISVPSGGGAGDGVVSFGMSTEGNTAGTTGTVSSGRAILVGTGVISLSQSVNGQSLSLSIGGPDTMSLSVAGILTSGSAGSTITLGVPGPMTLSGFNPYPDIEKIGGQVGQDTMQFDPIRVPDVAFDRVVIPIINTNSSNSSGSHTLSFWVGIYSRNASTLSLVESASTTTALTHSGTAGSYSLYSGQRIMTMGMTETLTAGDYWVAFVSRTTSGGANGTYSNLIGSNIASNFLGHFGSSHNTTYQLTLGQGVYTATTSGIPSSVAFSQIRGSDSRARRPVFVMFANGTV
jgi:hypothetical protein